MAIENVVLVTFEERQSLPGGNRLKEASAEGRVDLHAVAVMQMGRRHPRIKEGDADDFPAGTWTGGIVGGTTGGIGADVGRLGGPLGLLLGGTGGALLAPDRHRRRRSSRKRLATMARAIEPNETALIAHVTEPAVEVIDCEMDASVGFVVRWPTWRPRSSPQRMPLWSPRRKREGSSGKREVPSARRRSNRRSTTLRPSLGAVRDRS